MSRYVDPARLLVADVMTIDPIVVPEDAPVEEASHLLTAFSVSGLPVVDHTGALVGVISQSDLVAIQDAPIGRLIRAETSGICVGELMTSPAITIPMIGSLVEAATLMRDRRVHRLVALDDDGHPTGVLSAFDFVVLYADA